MLRRQEGYALRKIKEKNYLMPYGQKIADQRKGMVLNETGSFLWNFLEHPKEREEILKAVIQYYDCLLYTSPSPRDGLLSRMPSSA